MLQMNVYRRRRLFAYGSVAVALALILTAKRENNVRFTSGDMEDAKPHELWEYVSDFSNVAKLNPTM